MKAKYVDPPVKVLGISGKKNSGKTHFGKKAAQAGFIPLNLARHFKSEVVVLDGYPFEEVFGIEDRRLQVRRLLQQRGTEEGRHEYGEDVWVRMLETKIRDMIEHGAHQFVVTDVRFPNEVRWVRALGGRVYRLVGRGGGDDETSKHVSETALDGFDDWDRVIDNSPDRSRRAEMEFMDYLLEDFS